MNTIKTFMLLILMLSTVLVKAIHLENDSHAEIVSINDSLQLAELNRFWAEVSRTVKEGDIEGYKATYHEDAVVVFTTRKNKTSISIAKALINWKQDFIDTNAGKTENSVEFRFSQRVGDETTAHETGIFSFQSKDGSTKAKPQSFIHFEALLVKRDNAWLMIMEYQKSSATEEEWDLLE